MASLVADYGSDSATSEEDEDPGPEEQQSRETGARVVHNSNSRVGHADVTGLSKPEKNYFVPDDSDDEEEAEDVGSGQYPTFIDDQHQQNVIKLPKPNFDNSSPATPGGDSGNSIGDERISVFANPYRAAEEASNSLLEKHVKMTPTGNSQRRTILGKKVCWNYRKGRCRFGSTCKFAHDSDIAVTKQAVPATEGVPGTEAGGEANSVTNRGQ